MKSQTLKQTRPRG
ncbi:hypothetical protein E2C01_080218 [Portunus trituberculatus]|uniref:Uncharacterized protein n=1 Tax=Portunus trituberculatus TaxID=210409 RepID=A0A5B7IJ09_PORTR|nr:hypothetical protein [Portunus trituberculatus]